MRGNGVNAVPPLVRYAAEDILSWRGRDMRPKPKQFATQYASIFGDASVVSAYQYRRPYPAETFDLLISLLDADAETLRNLVRKFPEAGKREREFAADERTAADGEERRNGRWIRAVSAP